LRLRLRLRQRRENKEKMEKKKIKKENIPLRPLREILKKLRHAMGTFG